MVDRTNRKQAIFEQASELFMEKGYVGTSMRDLAEKVGIEPSSLYSHIKSKEDILSKICLDTAEAFVSGMKSIEQINDPIEQVRQVIDLHIQIAKEDRSSMTVFTNEWKHLPPNTRVVFENQRRFYQKQFKAIIQKGSEIGVFVRIDPSIAMKTILTSLRWVHFWTAPGKTVDHSSIGKTIKDFILRGLLTPQLKKGS